jgi:hypothetical protein
MKPRFFFALLLLAVLVLAGTACERQLPGPAVQRATTTPRPGLNLEFVTQTAAAAELIPPSATPTELAPLITQAPEVTEVAPEATQPPATQPPAAATEAPQAAAQPAQPAQETVTPTETSEVPVTWELRSGEYPWCLARRYDVNPAQLLAANGFGYGGPYYGFGGFYGYNNWNWRYGVGGYSRYQAPSPIVYAGMVFYIPQDAAPFPGPHALVDHPTTFTVDYYFNTIYKIACFFGDVDPLAIASANGLSAPYFVRVGQELAIP